MADLSDVETSLVGAVTAALYPSGLSAACVVGCGARIYRGWPMTAALSADLGNDIINVSVSPVPDTGKNTTRWGPYSWSEPAAAGLVAKVAGNAVIFSGEANPGDLAGILARGKAYVYQCRAGDGASLVASALFGLARQDQVCQLQGATLVLPSAPDIVARTAAVRATTTETGRQEQHFRAAVWAASPEGRDRACKVIGAQLGNIAFLPLADGTGGRLRYHNTTSIDDGQDAGVYRRDLIYQVEYPTTLSEMLPSMLFGDLVCNGVVTFA